MKAGSNARSIEGGLVIGTFVANWFTAQPDVVADVADPAGETVEHLVEHEEHRHLHQEGETTTQRVDVVLLVELQQLLVELLAVVLVPGLDLAHLRLELLHHHHRARALEGQRRHDDHDHERQHHDGEGVVRHEVVEERQGRAEGFEEHLHELGLPGGDGVPSVVTPGVTPPQPPQRQPGTSDETVHLESLEGVGGTRRDVATRRHPPGEEPLVAANDRMDHAGGDRGGSRGHGGHRRAHRSSKHASADRAISAGTVLRRRPGR